MNNFRGQCSVSDPDPHKEIPPGSDSGSAWTDADPGGKKLQLLSSVVDPHGSAFKKASRIRIQEVKMPRKFTGSLGKCRTGRIKVRLLL